ncbi:MAG: MBL fold metallo-hydrolase [Gemmatimonadota bacterium]
MSEPAGRALAPVVVTIPNGSFAQNCYLVADPQAGVAAMIDPGEEHQRILASLRHRGWRLEAIWLTHAHIDHILGVAAVKRETGAPIWLHPDDRAWYDRLADQAAYFGLARVETPPPPDHGLAHGQRVRIGGFEFAVRHTPGHSPGSVSFVGHGMVFGGDVLFQGSVGRTDLAGGDPRILAQTLEREFLGLPDDTVVHSGHGPATTIGAERAGNPFLRAGALIG